MKWVLLFSGLLSLPAQAGTLYLCKAYNGGTFWAQAHCSKHSALIERMVSVPDSLPFDQQVNLGEQQRRPAGNTTTTVTNTVTNNHTGNDQPSECRALAAQITQYDAQARQPQSGQMQDWISAQKKRTRARQFELRC